MAEGHNTPQSREEENNGGHLPNGDGENMEVDQGDTGEQSGDQAAGGDGETPQREITQTDHINKSLLTSFLDRLNDPTTSSQFPSTQVIDTEQDDD